MNKLLVAILFALIAAPSRAASPYKGVLDLGSAGADPSAIAFRELHDGMWLVGAQQQLWHLQNTRTDREVFHISGYWAARLEGQDKAYGPSLGLNVNEAVTAAVGKIEVLVPTLQAIGAKLPPWVGKLSAWTSVEVYGGYRPIVGSDDHHWVYGVGGKVTIPMSMLYHWAKGDWGNLDTNQAKGL